MNGAHKSNIGPYRRCVERKTKKDIKDFEVGLDEHLYICVKVNDKYMLIKLMFALWRGGVRYYVIR